ncbi:hypothetical protein Pmani_002641 [Petrolisthes manimaculis]|uniref:Uncharacterized protein n=1 Tax=Petrolisthes manimaculis TaxID=1843537 RepID=A0AAE1QKJ5_9EUCA|nr:hypothetical protein Pmani_002641 [Petrolisthes manimaculis]
MERTVRKINDFSQSLRRQGLVVGGGRSASQNNFNEFLFFSIVDPLVTIILLSRFLSPCTVLLSWSATVLFPLCTHR